ncbi:MAG: hypothetical protein JNK64_08465 [Myxococcales bacterium]|nr:hypothetical protein [Myxococcales bacterium]
MLYDRHGRIVEFYARLHLLVAKAGNVVRKRWENFWSSEPPCLVQLIDRADVLAKLVYVAINPVKDGLVERVHHWPGVSGLRALLDRRPIRVRRPPEFFDPAGEMPAEVTLALTVPPELERGDELRGELAAMVAAAEEHYARVRRKAGVRVLGRRAVLAQDWRDRPRAPEPRRGLRPRVAARDVWRRIVRHRRRQQHVDPEPLRRLRQAIQEHLVHPPPRLQQEAALRTAPRQQIEPPRQDLARHRHRRGLQQGAGHAQPRGRASSPSGVPASRVRIPDETGHSRTAATRHPPPATRRPRPPPAVR